jgi:hypothetical protein
MSRMNRAFAVLALASALVLANPPAGTFAQDGIQIAGKARQGVSFASSLSTPDTGSFGTGTSLDLDFRGQKGSASISFAGSLSMLSGRDVQAMWGSFLLDPGKVFGVLITPDFDPTLASPRTAGILKLRELAIGLEQGPFSFETGYTLANWGQGKAFSPADFFADIDYSSGQPERRSRVLFRASCFPGPLSRIDIVAAPEILSPGIVAARAYGLVAETLALGASIGYKSSFSSPSPSILGGIELGFDLPWFSPYGEAALRLPLEGSPQFSDIEASFMAGATAKLGSLTFLGEYSYESQGAAKHRIFGLASYPFDEWLSLSLPLSLYPDTGALSLGFTLSAADLWGLDIASSAFVSRDGTGNWSMSLSSQLAIGF